MTNLQYAWRALVRSPLRTFASVFGTFIAAALLSSVLLFVASSAGGMTRRTIASVPVDMRAEALSYSLDVPGALATLRCQPGVVAAQPFTLSHFSGSTFARDGRTSTTGPGAIVAVDAAYFQAFPAIRIVQGGFDSSGVVLSLDMGTNLGARVGDTIAVALPDGGAAYQARVTGIANMREADPLFAPTDPRLQGATFNPPANVLMLSRSVFDAVLFPRLRDAPPPSEPSTTGGSGNVVQSNALPVSQQIHLRINRASLSGDPTQAQLQTTQLRHTLEKLYPGQMRVSDELFAAIDAVKGDVLWAQVLFVFLALPAILLAAYLSRYTTETLVEDQRRQFAVLRARGASSGQVMAIVAIMSVLTGLLGSLLGILAGVLVTLGMSEVSRLRLDTLQPLVTTILWSLLAGFAITALGTFLPTRRLLGEDVASGRKLGVKVRGQPLWARVYLDVAAIFASIIVFRVTQINGFHPVLNAEGNPTISLSFFTFLAPVLFWLGSAFLLIRVAGALLRHSARWLNGPLVFLFGEVGSYAAAATAKRARAMSQAAVIVVLAISFGSSISIFANTYAQQQRVDAELTLGSDVKVTPTASYPEQATYTATLAHIPGVGATTPFKTTVAYVGTEIQDIFGVDVPTLRRSTNLSDTFFQGGTANETMNRLATTPDGILVSDEMARDYSIVIGDHVTIRLFNRASQVYQDGHFTVAGVAKEFPTAPKDAFLVVNLAALTQVTSDSTISFFLVKATGDPASLASTIQSRLGAYSVQAQSIQGVTARLATSLTSLNLNGLVTIGYAFAVVIATAGMAVFLLALLAERRREFATMRAVGAVTQQLAVFLLTEGGLIGLIGILIGLLIGGGLATMLVTILVSIFDPPPDGPIASLPQIAFLVALYLTGVLVAIGGAVRRMGSMRIGDALREA